MVPLPLEPSWSTLLLRLRSPVRSALRATRVYYRKRAFSLPARYIWLNGLAGKLRPPSHERRATLWRPQRRSRRRLCARHGSSAWTRQDGTDGGCQTRQDQSASCSSRGASKVASRRSLKDQASTARALSPPPHAHYAPGGWPNGCSAPTADLSYQLV